MAAATPGVQPVASPGSAAAAADRTLDPRTPFAQLPAECKGFEVVGLTHSPGGSVLPNLCAPFDGTYNNPFAIRCQEANPTYATKWPGDEYCILPPPPELGTQLYAGPKSYDNPADYADFEMMPGAEINTTYNTKATNAEARKYYRANYRMRDGSHHLIMMFTDEDLAEGWADQANVGFGEVGISGSNPSVQGTSRPDDDRPHGTLEIPAENVGIAGDLRPNQQVSLNLHHMNRFDKPILREAWVNFWYVPPEEVKSPLLGIFLLGNPQDVALEPGQHEVLHYASSITDKVRVIALWGHRHVSTSRFAAWLERASGETVSLYESFNYQDVPVYQYDSVSQNPPGDATNHVDGGHTGLVEMEPGDRLHYLCDVTNDQDVALRFTNELYTGEMCILWGNRTGAGEFNYAERIME